MNRRYTRRVRTPSTHSAERMADAILVVEALRGMDSLHADVCAQRPRIRSLDARCAPISDFGDHLAIDIAA